MMRDPIFRDLLAEDPDWPLCRICGAIWLTPFADPGNLCNQCLMLRRDENPECWHCFDCDEFLDGFNRTVFWHQGIPLFLCREHFDWRSGLAA